MKYLYPKGTRFGKSTRISPVHHIINPESSTDRSYCMRIFLNEDQYTDEPPPNTRPCILCAGHPRSRPQGPNMTISKEPKISDINPKHYEVVIDGRPIEGISIIEALFAKDIHLANAMKYLMRAGRKPDSSYLKDVSKCLWWCARAIMFHGGKYIELPPGTKTK